GARRAPKIDGRRKYSRDREEPLAVAPVGVVLGRPLWVLDLVELFEHPAEPAAAGAVAPNLLGNRLELPAQGLCGSGNGIDEGQSTRQPVRLLGALRRSAKPVLAGQHTARAREHGRCELHPDGAIGHVDLPAHRTFITEIHLAESPLTRFP